MSTPAPPTILVWGEVLWDRFPDGDQLGGAPANVAYHLGLIGQAAGDALRPALVSRVGDDADGTRAIARLATVVDARLVQRDDAHATGEVTVTLVGGEPRYRLVPGRAWEHIALTDEVRAALRTARALVFGTLSQRTASGLATFAEALAAAPSTCVRVCDPNLRPGTVDVAALRLALDAADVVKLGATELAACAAALDEPDLLTTLRRRCRLVAVTRGADGSTLYAGDEQREQPASPARPGGDNVGCGDAYVAAITAGVVLGWPLAKIGAVAARWSAEVASARGAPPVVTDDTASALLA
ncbi:MAG: PfkB family carbohydrate kinase [Kofleriaceae bacterium]